LVRDEVPDIEHVRVIRGDVRNYDDVQRLYYEAYPDLVFHLAAVAPVEHALRAPRQAIATNVMGSVNVIENHRFFCPQAPLIVASSDKAYGKSKTMVTESTELNPSHPYDASKAAADLLIKAYAQTYGVNLAITRSANVYGPGDKEWSRLIPGCIRAHLEKKTFQIRSNGKHIRDYIYIDDVVNAYWLLALTMSANYPRFWGVYNISAHCPRTVLEIVDIICQVMGRDPDYEVLGSASSETSKLVVNGAKFRTEFRWSPTVMLKEGIERTVEWTARELGFYA